MNPSDRVLRQFLAEALDPPRWEEVTEALARSASLRERLALLIAIPPIDAVATPWTLPPPGAPAPFVLGGSFALGGVMDADSADWIEISFAAPPDEANHVVVVLERRDGAWGVVFPTADEEVVRVTDLPPAAEGRRIDVTFTPEVDRLGIVLVPDPPDWTAADPWEAVRIDVVAGTRSVLTFPTNQGYSSSSEE